MNCPKIKSVISATALIVATAQQATAKVVVVECNDSTKIQISELNAESAYHYPFGDVIEVRLNHSRSGTGTAGIYRLEAEETATYDGHWVYKGPPGQNFRLELLSQSPIWYLEFENEQPLKCDRFID